MTSDLNNISLIGRLTADAEIKHTQSGAVLLQFALAVNRKRKEGSEVGFFDVQLWGKLAEALANYLTKGKQVAIEGELRQSKWTVEGKTKSKVYITANSLQMLADGKAPGSNGTRKSQEVVRSHSEFTNQKKSGGPEDFFDDIPF